MRARGGISALLDLPLKKLGCLQHCDNQKAPFGAAPQQINACALLFVPCWFLSRNTRVFQANARQAIAGRALFPIATIRLHLAGSPEQLDGAVPDHSLSDIRARRHAPAVAG